MAHGGTPLCADTLSILVRELPGYRSALRPELRARPESAVCTAGGPHLGVPEHAPPVTRAASPGAR